MYYKQIKKIALFLFMGGTIGTLSAQSVLKVGDNLYTISNNAALDVESKTKGFLPPRMTTVQRDAIVNPPTGLQVYCLDSNISTTPPTGELCIYVGTGWVPLTMSGAPRLSTNKLTDPNPSSIAGTAATIKGTLITSFGSNPTETGIVYREILPGDYGTLPILSATGIGSVPTYKTVGTLVTTDNSPMTVSIPTLGTTTGNTRPYYFRTYAKSPLGIGYGNAILLNAAPPSITTPVITGGTTLNPSFAATLTVNAGSQYTVTEYGYTSSTTTTTPTTADSKVVMSTAATLATINTALTAPSFSADPTQALNVPAGSFFPTIANGSTPTNFRFYVIANGVTSYSPVSSFVPLPDPVTGGSAIGTYAYSYLDTPLQINQVSTSNLIISFTITRAGTTGVFNISGKTGNTLNLSFPSSIAASFFSTGSVGLSVPITGTPTGYLDGNSIVVDRIGTVSTGRIIDNVGSIFAYCDAASAGAYIISPIVGTSGKTWMDRNLGASVPATSSSDINGFGCLFQWGRGNDGHASVKWASTTLGYIINGTSSTVSPNDTPGITFIVNSGVSDWRSVPNYNLWQGVTAGNNNPCPSGFRIPTVAELTTESTSWKGTVDAFASPLKLPATGYRSGNNGNNTNPNTGLYWSSQANNNSTASYLSIIASSNSISQVGRISGLSVRCISNN